MAKRGRVARWWRRLVDKARGRFYEGPEPPDRLGQMVSVFAAMYPRATVADWIQFASGHAEECYRSGFIRGVEYRTRSQSDEEQMLELVTATSRGATWVDLAPSPAELEQVVADNADVWERLSPEEQALHLDTIGRVTGSGMRVLHVPTKNFKSR